MDLQLGLGISSNSVKGFDLNCSESGMIEESKGDMDSAASFDNARKKRSFDEEFEEKNCGMPQTLPLLVWEGRGDNQDVLEKTPVEEINKVDRDPTAADGIVGWPPMNPWRKRICNQNHRGRSNIHCVTVENGGPARTRGKNYLYVKVKMEGMGIGRKVDLSLHHSHETLLQTLVAMFGKCRETLHAYQLIYQNKSGGWQPASDASWGAFIGSVQRMKLLRRRE